MSISQEYGRFNIYDIFSTFLPGAIVVIGVAAPHPAAPYFASVGFGTLIIWTVVAFTVGLLIQSLGSELVSGEEGFHRRMSSVVERDDDDDDVTLADIDFLETARDEFDFDAEFEDWNRLYRAVLTDLERNPPSRAIRLQALFLAMRALVVGTAVLAVTTIAYVILWGTGFTSISVPVLLLVVTVILLIILAAFTYTRAEEFSEDVVEYMIIEFRMRH